MREHRTLFNEKIKYSAVFIDGVKLVPLEFLLPLKLGFTRAYLYVEYETAFRKFEKKLKNPTYSKLIKEKKWNI